MRKKKKSSGRVVSAAVGEILCARARVEKKSFDFVAYTQSRVKEPKKLNFFRLTIQSLWGERRPRETKELSGHKNELFLLAGRSFLLCGGPKSFVPSRLSRLPAPSSTHNVAESVAGQALSLSLETEGRKNWWCLFRCRLGWSLKQKRIDSGGPPVTAEGGSKVLLSRRFSVQFRINPTDQTQWPSSKENGVERQCQTSQSVHFETFLETTFQISCVYIFFFLATGGSLGWRETRWRARFLPLKCFFKRPEKKMAAGGGRSIYTNFEIVFNAPLSGMSLLNTIFFRGF